jgi:hypothetical protein
VSDGRPVSDLFAVCLNCDTRQRYCLPCVRNMAHGKEGVAVCPVFTVGRRLWHTAKMLFAVCPIEDPRQRHTAHGIYGFSRSVSWSNNNAHACCLPFVTLRALDGGMQLLASSYSFQMQLLQGIEGNLKAKISINISIIFNYSSYKKITHLFGIPYRAVNATLRSHVWLATPHISENKRTRDKLKQQLNRAPDCTYTNSRLGWLSKGAAVLLS